MYLTLPSSWVKNNFHFQNLDYHFHILIPNPEKIKNKETKKGIKPKPTLLHFQIKPTTNSVQKQMGIQQYKNIEPKWWHTLSSFSRTRRNENDKEDKEDVTP